MLRPVTAFSAQRDGGRLQRPPRLSPLGSLLLRLSIVIGLIVVAIAGHWLDRNGYRDNYDGAISFTDVLYFTAVTVTTTGFGDIVPVSDQARMFDTFVVTPIRMFIWLVFLGTAYEFVVQHMWERWRMEKISKALCGHYIVAGYGTTGTAAVHELLANSVQPDKIVVIDVAPARVEAALGTGVLALEGDATRNEAQSLAGVERATSFIACSGRDDTAALLVLTARQMNPSIRISAVIRSEDNEDLVRKAGADTVINPVTLGGHMLARAADGSNIVDYINDLIVADGRVQLIERAATPAEIGLPLRACGRGLAVRIIRGRQPIGFWEDAATQVAAGDILLEIVPIDGVAQAG
jgi:voltage-gated potassium channel